MIHYNNLYKFKRIINNNSFENWVKKKSTLINDNDSAFDWRLTSFSSKARETKKKQNKINKIKRRTYKKLREKNIKVCIELCRKTK